MASTFRGTAIRLVHQNRVCFVDNESCEQLAWQAHRLSVLKHSVGDTYFIAFNKEGLPSFYNKKIRTGNTFNMLKNQQIFIDKTGSAYGMSSYMAYIPYQKIGVVILTNKFLGDERIKLGREILQTIKKSNLGKS